MVLLVEPVGRGLSGYRRRHRTVGLAVAVIDDQLPIGLGISHDVVVLACHRCDRSADLLRGNRHSRGGGECSGKHTRIRKCAGTLPSKIQTLKLGYVKQCNVKSTIAKKNRKLGTKKKKKFTSFFFESFFFQNKNTKRLVKLSEVS